MICSCSTHVLLILLFLIMREKCETHEYKEPEKKFVMTRGKNNNYTTQNIEEEEEELAFPGLNKNNIFKIEDMWKNYYKCLEGLLNETVKPEIYRLLEGQNIDLKCQICPKPFQDYEEIEWKYRPLSPDLNITTLQHLDLSPAMEYSNIKTLKLYNVIEDYAGLYVCYHGKNEVSTYIIEISKNDTIEKVTPYISQDVEIIKLEGPIEFEINYRWGKWTECSSCGEVGRRYKYATCFISHRKEIQFSDIFKTMKRRTKKDLRNFTTTFNILNKLKSKAVTNNNQSVENEESAKWVYELTKRFRNGVPCFSTYVSNLGLTEIQKRPAIRANVKHCMVTCPESEIFEVFDKFGNLIEMANNSAGIYSAFQKIPTPPPDIDRRSISAEFGTDVIIQCPSTLHRNIPVVWKINKKVIFPEVIANESQERFTIDLVNRIHIKKLRLKDDHIYSCWQRDKLVGTVHLAVEKKFKINFDHHVTLVAILLIIGVFSLVGIKILARELQKKKR